MSAAFKLTTAGGAILTHVLPDALNFQVVPSRGVTRYRRDSLDRSALEVIAIGSGREEIQAYIRGEPNAHDLIEFLSYAADGSVLKYYPDTEGPGFDLWNVGDGEEVGVEWDDGRSYFYKYNKPVRFRDASTSGTSLEALHSPWLWRHRGGMARRYATFTRTGTVGAYKDIDGLLKQAAANVLRTTWATVNGVYRPLTRLEVPRTNKLLRSETLDNASWTKSQSSIVTNTSVGPDGVASLDQLVEDGATDIHVLSQNVTGMTANANYVLSGWFRANTRSWAWMDVYETAAGANVARVWFNLSTGAVGANSVGGTGAFVRGYVEDWTHVVTGLYRCVLVGSVGNGATAITGRAGLATGDGVTSYAGNGTSSIWCGYMQLEEGLEASSYIPTTTATVTRGAEAFTDSFPYTPQQLAAMGGATFYFDFVEGLYPNWVADGVNAPVLAAVGNAALDTSVWVVDRPAAGDSYRVQHNAGSSTVDLNPTRNDRIQLAAQFNTGGSVRLIGRKNGGADTTGSASSAVSPASEFSAQAIRIGGAGATGRGIQDYADVIVFPGVLDISACEAKAV